MSKVQIKHFHDVTNGRLVMTIATSLVDSETVRVAAAVASPTANSNRQLGTQIATGRLLCERPSVEEKGHVLVMPLAELQQRIVDRSIAELFPKPRGGVPALRGPTGDKKRAKRAAKAQ